MIKKLLIATHNKAKLAELKQFLKPLLQKTEYISLSDLNIIDEPEETGKTFLDNAKLKAEYYAKRSNIPTLSDDGGLVIDILNGEPGVHSNRWMGHRGTDIELISYSLKRMEGVTDPKRSAKLKTCVFFYNPTTGESAYEVEMVEGKIAKMSSIKIEKGYPYRSVFIVSKFNKYYSELSKVEHEQINHRYKALKRLALKLKTWYN